MGFLSSVMNVISKPKAGYTFILDNGHSGMINGVYVTVGKHSPVWPDGRQLFEGVFNREVVAEICSLLDKAGIKYVKLVPENSDVSLAERCTRANKIHKDNNGNTVLISIHGNGGGGTGFEVFTTKGVTKADAIATILFNELDAEFPEMKARADWQDGDPDREEQFYILRNTAMPAVLSENFFMDTLKPDCELMMSEEGVKRIAKAHFNAIKKINQK